METPPLLHDSPSQNQVGAVPTPIENEYGSFHDDPMFTCQQRVFFLLAS